MKRAFVLIAAVLLIVGIPAVGGASNGIACGDTVTQDITLTHDLADCPGDGLKAGAAGITINLGGYTISADGGDAGVRINAFVDDVTILNGTITGFNDGVRADITSGNHISRLNVTGNTRGINLANVDDSVVEKNTLSGNVLDAIRVDGDSDDNLVQQNVLTGGVWGVTVSNNSDDNVITKNHVTGALWGISVFTDALGNEVSRNDVTGNVLIGIQIERRSHDAVVARNIVSGNWIGILITGFTSEVVLRATVERNDVFDNSGDGVQVAGDDGLVTRNDVYDNGGYGINLTSTADNNVVSRNDVFGNALGGINDSGTGNTIVLND